MEIVDFATLAPARHADAARILRDALAHLPSAYNAPGDYDRLRVLSGRSTP